LLLQNLCLPGNEKVRTKRRKGG